jgi:hypothetical protein
VKLKHRRAFPDIIGPQAAPVLVFGISSLCNAVDAGAPGTDRTLVQIVEMNACSHPYPALHVARRGSK